jgi:hypothetical protein
MKARAHTQGWWNYGELEKTEQIVSYMIRREENVFLEVGIPTSSHLEGAKRRALTLFSPTLS